MDTPAIERLRPFIGEWSMRTEFPNAPPSDDSGRTVFEWMPGGEFVVQRWEVPHPDAPDGLAVVGLDPEGDFLQH